ncbi:MAG: transglutaminase-like cysteine peptidase [Kiloniellales bacterium]
MFSTQEFRSDSLKALPQWARVIASMRREWPGYRRCADDAKACDSTALKSWRELIVAARGLDRVHQIDTVNRFFNRWPYKSDKEIYGVREYWATPTEFLSRSGDCEDYSIAKYYALRALGFEPESLRVVILMDRIRGIGHAVLAVYTGSDILILDSLSDLIVSHSRYKHYIPQYSMNETTRWAHLSPQLNPGTPAGGVPLNQLLAGRGNGATIRP